MPWGCYMVTGAWRDMSRQLRINLRFQWNLLLESSSESEPRADFFISTIYCPRVTRLMLEKASGEKNIQLVFDVRNTPEKAITHDELVENCVLNVDFVVHTAAKYDECVPNPAGGAMIPLYDILAAKDGVVKADIHLFMVHDANRNVKGSVTISPMKPLAGMEGKSPVMITYGDAPFNVSSLTSGRQSLLIRNSIAEARQRSYITIRYINAADEIYGNEGGLKPTLPTVRRVNSTIYVTRSGATLPLFYTVDIVQPEIDIKFLANQVEIVRRRMRLRHSDILAMDMRKPRPDVLKRFGSFVGQILCAYVVHCTYRDDFVMAWDVRMKKFIKVLTENFGDVTVDMGSGDCEDFGKIIMRIYLAFRRYRLDPAQPLRAHPILEKVSEFLGCFVAFLVLYGVSGAQINEQPSRITKMGAHENTMLTPLHQVIEEIRRFHPDIDEWVRDAKAVEPRLDEFIELSKSYHSLNLEGTGVLEPTPGKEDNVEIRQYIERHMSDEAFHALRRSYYYDANHNSFYKTVDKIFTPYFLLTGARFGSFLVLQETQQSVDASPTARAAMPFRARYTKSADFALFIKNDPRVAMVMEPHLADAEIQAAQAVMKDIHPSEPMLGPPRHFEKRDRLDALITSIFGGGKKSYVWDYRSEALGPEEIDPPVQAGLVEQVYYLRFGKVYRECLEAIERLCSELGRRKTLVRVVFYPEWATDVVGGYRLVFEMNASLISG